MLSVARQVGRWGMSIVHFAAAEPMATKSSAMQLVRLRRHRGGYRARDVHGGRIRGEAARTDG